MPSPIIDAGFLARLLGGFTEGGEEREPFAACGRGRGGSGFLDALAVRRGSGGGRGRVLLRVGLVPVRAVRRRGCGRGGCGRGGGGRGGGGRGGGGAVASTGTYRVLLTVAGRVYEGSVTVREDPATPTGGA
jgi:hypothetical protein